MCSMCTIISAAWKQCRVVHIECNALGGRRTHAATAYYQAYRTVSLIFDVSCDVMVSCNRMVMCASADCFHWCSSFRLHMTFDICLYIYCVYRLKHDEPLIRAAPTEVHALPMCDNDKTHEFHILSFVSITLLASHSNFRFFPEKPGKFFIK